MCFVRDFHRFARKNFFTLCSVFFVSSLSFIFILLLSSSKLWKILLHGFPKNICCWTAFGQDPNRTASGFPEAGSLQLISSVLTNRGKFSLHGLSIYKNICDIWTACGQDPFILLGRLPGFPRQDPYIRLSFKTGLLPETLKF